MFKNLSTSTKLIILCGMFILSIGVTTHSLVAEHRIAIDFARRELLGNRYLAILRNVCRVEFGRRARVVLYDGNTGNEEADDTVPLWQEAQENPESELLRKLDAKTIQSMVTALPEAFREVVVLRELEDLSYREIADVVGAPVGTVMSRLARARALLREGWLKAASDGEPQQQETRIGKHKELLV